MQDFVDIIVNNGMSVAIIGYFLYKDYKFNASILSVLSEVKEVLSRLCVLTGAKE